MRLGKLKRRSRPNRWHNYLSGSGQQYTYDTNNRITTSGITYDAMGNITGDGTHTYTYDPEGRLIKVDGGATAVYTYDAMGRRARRVVGSSTYDYVFDPAGHPFEEIIPPSTGNRYEVYTPIGRLNVYASNTTYFYHADWLGTVRRRTDPTGTVVDSFANLPFGEAVSGSSPVHFTDQDRDSETGFDHFLFRQYSSVRGRWTVPDPAGMAAVDPTDPQTLNRYAYVGNNPTNVIDPLGLLWACVSADDWFGDYINFGCEWFTSAADRCGIDGCGTPRQPGNNPDGPPCHGGNCGGGNNPGTSSAPHQGGDRAALCAIDVALNYAFGFIPGYNFVKLAGTYAGVNFNFTQAIAGYDSFVSLPNAVDATSAASSISAAIAKGNFEIAGGATALNRAADLVSRNSFLLKSASSQSKLLSNLSNLSNLSKLASGLGTVAQIANTGAAIYDAYKCLEKK